MSQILTLKLDVTKIHKDAIYVGEKGKYVTVTVFLKDEADDRGQYGMVTQDLGQNVGTVPPAVAAALAKHGGK